MSDWEAIAHEGYRLWWRAMILTGVFVIALVTSCTVGDQSAWNEWHRQQRAACNEAGGSWTNPVGGSYDKVCVRQEEK